ncbi:TRAP transporter small permease [Alcaligenaceae bacterium]|nr:TRAP transporter small permease [Alcaligenaceae bacterium]
MLYRLEALMGRAAFWLSLAGGLIILIQVVWISYGVFMRYVVGRPDGMVTEATALLLFPTAFLGLAWALKEDAYPKVSFLPDALRGKWRRMLDALNLLLMVLVGGFFAYTAVSATLRSYESMASSEVLLWPRYLFWIGSALALVVFTLYALICFLMIFKEPVDIPVLKTGPGE